ncbi:MAG: ABC transporter permease [Lachnospiraceae bacterium]|nr:ABC transporter permease [Lachnospiraceae bacterium]
MSFLDMLSFSVLNLWKRKARTVLTVMGVTIGVASIVVMISLGLGLSKSTMEDIQSYASLTAITVREGDTSAANERDRKRLDDALIDEISRMEHVRYVAPILNVSVIAKYGAYSAWMDVQGTTLEYLRDMNIEVGEGTLPTEQMQELELFYGNGMLEYFSTASGKSYWETGELPDIDLMEDSILYILDSEAYYGSQGGSQGGSGEEDGQPVAPPKKHLIKTAGVAAGGPEDYHPYSWSVYCDIERLIPVLRREFKNRPIPGQPTTKAGKAYKQLYYSQLIAMCDDMNNVSEVDSAIRNLGYNTYNDSEWIASNQQQMRLIEAVLGGIGAVSLLVAAIGITNTMVMSIYERTKEIGIMKVLGCDIRNIQMMFLIEAGFIGFLGGVTGILISYGLSFVINALVGKSGVMGVSGSISYIPPWLPAVGLVFAVLVGMISGFFPSRRAMRLSPLSAIRNDG